MTQKTNRNILLTLQYDGTAYHGFQVQDNAISVCEVFQDALEKITGSRHEVKGCSRTDTGVHALDYKMSFTTQSSIPTHRFPVAMNRVLPKDIAVLEAREVPKDFHARYSATGKTYIYRIHNSRIKNPFYPSQRYFYPLIIDENYLNTEIQSIVGTHDFAGFCTNAKAVENTVRTITSAKVTRAGENIQIEVTGDGFLHNMVRIIVGTMLEINSGRIKKGELEEIIKSKDRSRAGATAPSHGLYLTKVYYLDF